MIIGNGETRPSYMLSDITLVLSRRGAWNIKMSWQSRCRWRRSFLEMIVRHINKISDI